MNNTPAYTAQDAIDAALQQDWLKAIDINKNLLKINSKDIDSYNRIGFAYLQIGKVKEAKEAFETVLSLDQYNQIAERNLTKLKNKGATEVNGSMVSPLMFLEEPGKTKVISCINLGPAATLSAVRCGQVVHMKVKKHTIELRDDQQVYVAALPDDVSYKLSRFIAGGNLYSVVIRSVTKNSLTIFIRELSRGKEFLHQPSFTPSSTYVPNTKTEESNEKPDTTATGEEQEASEA